MSTSDLSRFMARLGAIGGGNAVIDPACGAGLLLAMAEEELGHSDAIFGIDLNRDIAEIARLVVPRSAEIANADSLDEGLALASMYDLVISEPPFNAPLSRPYKPAPALKNVGEALLHRFSGRLSLSGRGVFLFPPSCVGEKGKKLWDSLRENKVYLRALIHVPSGHLKSTAIDSYIVVVDRIPRDEIFTAQFSVDDALITEILGNYEAHRSGSIAAQGRLVNLSEFRGFKALEASERLKVHAKRAGLLPIRMRDLIVKHEVLKNSSETVDDLSNDLYLPLAGRCRAVLQPGEITSKTVPIARLVLNETLADARFVAASLNREVGKWFLESVTLPTFGIRRIGLEQLLDATFYLPERSTQEKVMSSMSKVIALRAELDEIETSIWSHPTRIEKEVKQLRKLNHQDSFDGWVETIPFPLASILWLFHASGDSRKDKIEILLHFFEGLAEFWATIYLSAAKTDREFWADHASGLHETVQKAKLSFDLATFGLWKCVLEYFSKKFRELRERDPERCSAMFGTSSDDVLCMLFDRRLLT
ncbi:MAG: N-6 DNA methylase, partial [Verrucomicrobiae bacterium]|nr:N-6 DNA methylase [Verrucomicrobiae bacterium]